MTEAAPLSCPFCGSDAVQMEREDDEGAWFGHCQRCDTEGPAVLSEGVALAAWNRRAPQADLAAMSADELRTRLQACLEVQRETAAHNRRLRGELDGEIAPQAEPAELRGDKPSSFDCALIVRCAKWCGKEKCRDHDAIAHAELVKAARLVARVANGNQGLEGNAWKAALAALRAALPPEGKETP